VKNKKRFMRLKGGSLASEREGGIRPRYKGRLKNRGVKKKTGKKMVFCSVGKKEKRVGAAEKDQGGL